MKKACKKKKHVYFVSYFLWLKSVPFEAWSTKIAEQDEVALDEKISKIGHVGEVRRILREQHPGFDVTIIGFQLLRRE